MTYRTDLAMQQQQIDATLSLAYEQRTANLIAAHDAGVPMSGVEYDALLGQIIERLGLSAEEAA